MSTQDDIKLAFQTYWREYGEGYDRFTFLDCVAATLCTEADAEQLMAHHRQALVHLGEVFAVNLQTCCPGCASPCVVQRLRGAAVWVAKDWIDPSDNLEREVDHCPDCGIELLDSDECGRIVDAGAVVCLCGHAAASHANAATECNACKCNTFQLDYESALVTP